MSVPDISDDEVFYKLADMTYMAAEFIRENAQKEIDDANRVLVHCRSGRGRTGTFITLLNSYIALLEQKNQDIAVPQLSIFSTLRRLREQRRGCIETESQYLFVYWFIQKWWSSF